MNVAKPHERCSAELLKQHAELTSSSEAVAELWRAANAKRESILNDEREGQAIPDPRTTLVNDRGTRLFPAEVEAARAEIELLPRLAAFADAVAIEHERLRRVTLDQVNAMKKELAGKLEALGFRPGRDGYDNLPALHPKVRGLTLDANFNLSSGQARSMADSSRTRIKELSLKFSGVRGSLPGEVPPAQKPRMVGVELQSNRQLVNVR